MMRKSHVIALALGLVVAPVLVDSVDARGRGGGGFRGGGGGGGFRGGGGARTSISSGGFSRSSGSFSRPSGGYSGGARASSGGFSRPSGSTAARPSGGQLGTGTRTGGQVAARGDRNVNRNVNRSRDVNRNIDRDVNVYGDRGYYRGGYYYGGAPFARAAVGAAAIGLTAAAIGSIAYSLPAGCGSFYAYGNPYYNCGGTYYAPQYQGDNVTYVVVEQPEGAPADVSTTTTEPAPIDPGVPPPDAGVPTTITP